MSITLNNSDFQCLQDQLVDLKTKNYELAEKTRRGQADFEAAKAKICSLQLKLEEQERDFQITSSTLRKEIESFTTNTPVSNVKDDTVKEEHHKAKYKKLLHKAKELQQRYEKSVDMVKQLDEQNAKINERILKRDEECAELRSDITSLKSMLESQSDERKIQERKGIQIVRELKRQLALEKNKTETLQTRIENLLKEPPITNPISEPENTCELSTASSAVDEESKQNVSYTESNPSSQTTSEMMLIEEQAILMERVTRLQHDKWILEEKLSYLEQMNSSLKEDLANKSDLIKHYFNDLQKRCSSFLRKY